MRDALGVVIGRSSITAALFRGETVAWTAERAVQTADEREQVLRDLLTAAPGNGGRKRALGVIVEAPLAQVRQLEGIPTLNDRLTARLVRENASAFFLKREGGVVVTSIHRSEGAVWSAAVDAEVVRDITTAADSLRFDLLGVAASSQFLNADSAGSAAHLNHRSPLVWTREDVNRDRRRFRAIAAMTGAVALVASAVPIVHAALDESRMRRELVDSHRIESEARRALAELRRLSRSLDERAAFDASRGRVTHVLTAVADALPDSTAILSLRVDSLEVNLVALSPRVTQVLPALDAVSQSVRIIGPVSHEVVDGNRFERAAFRLRRTAQRLR